MGGGVGAAHGGVVEGGEHRKGQQEGGTPQGSSGGGERPRTFGLTLKTRSVISYTGLRSIDSRGLMGEKRKPAQPWMRLEQALLVLRGGL